ncbi:MAG: hypothetical protein HKL96_13335 [Phycisphaerales bacterium]|nr:hypothetical protein [Phycisphaerales bacterium]
MIRWPGADSDFLWCGSGNVGLRRGAVMGIEAGLLPRRGWSLCGGIGRFLGDRFDSQLPALGRLARRVVAKSPAALSPRLGL